METQAFSFAASRFVPVAIGFFGLGTGYFIWGGQALFGFPRTSPEVNRTMGMWGFWMPGFMQFITGVYLLVGLTWFNVFGNAAPYIYGRSRLHGLWHSLVCHGPSPLHRFKCTTRWLDGDRIPLPKHSGSGRFPARGRHSCDDHLRRFEFDLRDRNSDTPVLVECWLPPRRSLSVCHRNLAYVLHLRHDSGPGPRGQSMGLDK